MRDLVESNAEQFAEFISDVPSVDQVQNGYDNLLREFRQRIVWNSNSKVSVRDDATFALLRRGAAGDSRK
jgi:hypothetical protein